MVFDSSFLIAVLEHPTPWKEDILDRIGAFRPVVLSSVRSELLRLSKRNGKGRFAALALTLLESGRFVIVDDGGGSPDDEILSYAVSEGAIVATIDSDLQRRLRARKLEVVGLRKGRVFA